MICDLCKKEILENQKYLRLLLPEKGRPGMSYEKYRKLLTAYVEVDESYIANHPTYTREVNACRPCCMKIQDILWTIDNWSEYKE